MPHGDTSDAPGADFRSQVLALRGRAGLNQKQVADLVGVSERAVQAWEAGRSVPSPERLQVLIGLYVERGVFAPARVRDEAAAFWEAAWRESPRFKAPFDRAWFEELLVGAAGAQTEVGALATATSTEPARQDWGEAPDVGPLYGRAAELGVLTRWIEADACRVVAVLGTGGIGKTSLAVRLAQDLAPAFDRLVWRSLRNALPFSEWLAETATVLAHQPAALPDGEDARLLRLLQLLRERRCLLVLDDLETVLEPGTSSARYREGCEGYGALLRLVAETAHGSCLLLTSREEPVELAPLEGGYGAVRALRLGPLDEAAGRAVLADRALVGVASAWAELVERYGGNPLALRIVGETIREVFGGDIGAFLTHGQAVFGGVRRLLDEQLARLSPPERDVLVRLALGREPLTFDELVADLGAPAQRGEVLEAVEALQRRSLLERGDRRATFTPQPLVLEHVTDDHLERVADEIVRRQPMLLTRYALVKARAKEYVRRAQERLLATPLLERLGGTAITAQQLIGLLDDWRDRANAEQGYGPGNVVNLLRVLRGSLSGLDLSHLVLRQVHLADVEARDTSLADSYLAESVSAEPFGPVLCAALSADASLLAAGTVRGHVKVWRVADRAPMLDVQLHVGSVWGVALNARGDLAVSGGADGTVRLWDVPNGRCLAILGSHAGGVRGVALSGDGQRVASAGLDGTVRLWNVQSGAAAVVLEGHTAQVWSVALSADGQRIVSGGADRTVRLWGADTGRCLAIMEGHTTGVRGVALSAEGDAVVSGGADGTVRVWDAASSQCRAVLREHTGWVWAVAVSSDGRRAASGGADGTVRLWDTSSGRCEAIVGGHLAGVWGTALSADGACIASSGPDGTVRMWDTSTHRSMTVFEGHTGGVWGVALSGDGERLVSGGLDGAVHLWNVAHGRRLAFSDGHAAEVWAVALSADGQTAASGGADGVVRLWDTTTGGSRRVLEGHTAPLRAVALSADGARVASGAEDATVRLWDAPHGRCLAVLEGHTAGVWGVALSGDGRLVASGGLDGTLRLWDAASARCQAVLEGHGAEIWTVALSADGTRAASGADDATVRVWETSTGRCLAVLEGQEGGVWGVALSADGQLVASSSAGGVVRLWDVPTGRLLAELAGNTDGIWGVSVTAAGDRLASGGADGIIRLWDAPFTGEARTLQRDRPCERLDISGLTGITESQRAALLALGAVERTGDSKPTPLR